MRTSVDPIGVRKVKQKRPELQSGFSPLLSSSALASFSDVPHASEVVRFVPGSRRRGDDEEKEHRYSRRG
jgi:hypothetical protein